MDCNFKQTVKEIKKRHNKTMIEIWTVDGFSGKTITIVDYRDGSITDYVLEKKSKLQKGDVNGYIDTDDYLKPNGYKRMRTLEDILD